MNLIGKSCSWVSTKLPISAAKVAPTCRPAHSNLMRAFCLVTGLGQTACPRRAFARSGLRGCSTLDLDAERAGARVGREQKVRGAEEVVRSGVDAIAVSGYNAPSDPDPVGAQGQPAITIETLDVGRWSSKHVLTVHGARGAGYWTLVYDTRADESREERIVDPFPTTSRRRSSWPIGCTS
jgi:hypothetical protein